MAREHEHEHSRDRQGRDSPHDDMPPRVPCLMHPIMMTPTGMRKAIGQRPNKAPADAPRLLHSWAIA
ncbi:hypothetical protein GCM10023074_03100 [Microbispora amethystogenes]